MIAFMNDTLHDMSIEAPKRWPYVYMLVRIALEEVAKARIDGTLVSMNDVYQHRPTARLIYAALSGSVVVEEFSPYFRHHPSIAPVLTDHLWQQAVLRDEWEIEVKKLQSDINSAAKAADKASKNK